MLERAWQARRAAAGTVGPGRLLAERVGTVEALVALLALATGVATLFRVRRRERRHSLHLGGSGTPGGTTPPPPSGGP